MTENRAQRDSKQKILETARQLFSRYGFSGTSVRDIAKACNVNLAAINYHFASKENLFWEVMVDSFTTAESFCQKFADSSHSLEDFALQLFHHLMNDSDLTRNTMKLILSENLSEPKDEWVNKNFKGILGPPGGQYFVRFLKQEVPFEMNRKGQLWGVKAIFNFIVHFSMLASTPAFKVRSKLDPLLAKDQLCQDLRWLVQSTLSFLKTHPEEFEERRTVPDTENP